MRTWEPSFHSRCIARFPRKWCRQRLILTFIFHVFADSAYYVYNNIIINIENPDTAEAIRHVTTTLSPPVTSATTPNYPYDNVQEISACDAEVRSSTIGDDVQPNCGENVQENSVSVTSTLTTNSSGMPENNQDEHSETSNPERIVGQMPQMIQGSSTAENVEDRQILNTSFDDMESKGMIDDRVQSTSHEQAVTLHNTTELQTSTCPETIINQRQNHRDISNLSDYAIPHESDLESMRNSYSEIVQNIDIHGAMNMDVEIKTDTYLAMDQERITDENCSNKKNICEIVETNDHTGTNTNAGNSVPDCAKSIVKTQNSNSDLSYHGELESNSSIENLNPNMASLMGGLIISRTREEDKSITVIENTPFLEIDKTQNTPCAIDRQVEENRDIQKRPARRKDIRAKLIVEPAECSDKTARNITLAKYEAFAVSQTDAKSNNSDEEDQCVTNVIHQVRKINLKISESFRDTRPIRESIPKRNSYHMGMTGGRVLQNRNTSLSNRTDSKDLVNNVNGNLQKGGSLEAETKLETLCETLHDTSRDHPAPAEFNTSCKTDNNKNGTNTFNTTQTNSLFGDENIADVPNASICKPPEFSPTCFQVNATMHSNEEVPSDNDSIAPISAGSHHSPLMPYTGPSSISSADLSVQTFQSTVTIQSCDFLSIRNQIPFRQCMRRTMKQMYYFSYPLSHPNGKPTCSGFSQGWKTCTTRVECKTIGNAVVRHVSFLDKRNQMNEPVKCCKHSHPNVYAMDLFLTSNNVKLLGGKGPN